MGFNFFYLENDMKANLKKAKNVGKENYILRMELYIKENL